LTNRYPGKSGSRIILRRSLRRLGTVILGRNTSTCFFASPSLTTLSARLLVCRTYQAGLKCGCTIVIIYDHPIAPVALLRAGGGIAVQCGEDGLHQHVRQNYMCIFDVLHVIAGYDKSRFDHVGQLAPAETAPSHGATTMASGILDGTQHVFGVAAAWKCR
jgi:hypothetical protein